MWPGEAQLSQGNPKMFKTLLVQKRSVVTRSHGFCNRIGMWDLW